MLRSLKEVQADDSVVGFYQATMLGAFFNQTLVDTQAIHQDKLRHGGVVVVHGETPPYWLEKKKRLQFSYYNCGRFDTDGTRKRFVPSVPAYGIIPKRV
jgi:hypothetical protein